MAPALESCRRPAGRRRVQQPFGRPTCRLFPQPSCRRRRPVAPTTSDHARWRPGPWTAMVSKLARPGRRGGGAGWPGDADRAGRRAASSVASGELGNRFRLRAARQRRWSAAAGGDRPLRGDGRRQRSVIPTLARGCNAIPSCCTFERGWSGRPGPRAVTTVAVADAAGATNPRSATCWASPPAPNSRRCAARAASSPWSAWPPPSSSGRLRHPGAGRARRAAVEPVRPTARTRSTCRWTCCSASRRRCTATRAPGAIALAQLNTAWSTCRGGAAGAGAPTVAAKQFLVTIGDRASVA